MRPIFFLGSDPRIGSCRLRGVQIARRLSDRGLPAHFVTALPSKLKDSFVVFVKHVDLELAEQMAARGNLLIYDCIDGHQATIRPKPGAIRRLIGGASQPVRLADVDASIFRALIFPNEQARKALAPAKLRSEVILHPWDERCAPVAGRPNFSIVFLGLSGLIPPIPGLVTLKLEDSLLPESILSEAALHSCHLSIRDPEGYNDSETDGDRKLRYLAKSNIKLSTAAALGANIVTTMDPGCAGLLPPEYPYLSEPSDRAVLATVERARAEFGGPEWLRGLAIMDQIRERTRIEHIAEEYLTLFRSF